MTRRRRWRRYALAGGLLAVGLSAIIGCTSIVTPPTGVRDPVTVVLVRDAIHVGLVFPRADGTHVEYGFGDWDWYAHNHDRWYHTFDTVLWPTQGTLARRPVPVQRAGLDAFYRQAKLSRLRVERDRAAAKLAALDAAFAAERETYYFNERYQTEFVHAGASFCFLYNCNDAITDWLREMGCTVSFVPIRLGFSVTERPREATAPAPEPSPRRCP